MQGLDPGVVNWAPRVSRNTLKGVTGGDVVSFAPPPSQLISRRPPRSPGRCDCRALPEPPKRIDRTLTTAQSAPPPETRPVERNFLYLPPRALPVQQAKSLQPAQCGRRPDTRRAFRLALFVCPFIPLVMLLLIKGKKKSVACWCVSSKNRPLGGLRVNTS